MKLIKFPAWVWFGLCCTNIFIFWVGFSIEHRDLMLLAILSGMCCALSYRLTGEDNDE
tara:strand:- start:179 stop:352 length:174 start_codon:yes stop_codon:yes gene_type:complete